MKSLVLSVACLLTAALALADGKKPNGSLTVTPLRGESKISSSGQGSLLRSSSNLANTGSKTIERNMKWRAEVRFRDQPPEKTELRVYYIGMGDGGKKLKQLGQEQKALTLDKNGRAAVELTSPKATLCKTRSRTSSSSGSRSSGLVSVKSTTSGERVTGCVIQLFADGELVKSYASDSRWTVAAGKNPFSLAELEARNGKIGLR